MATRYKRKPQPIDYKKSRRWALATLGSAGAGIGPLPVGAGAYLFDLLNLSTSRAHSVGLVTGGVGYNFDLVFTGSFGSSDYEAFTTPSGVDFFHFDGLPLTRRDADPGVYYW